MIDCPFAHAELESKIGSRRKLVELKASKMARRLSAAVTFPLLPPISARILQAKGAGFLHLIKFFSYLFKIFFL